MTQLYGDEYDDDSADDDRLIPGKARRLAGAAVFLVLVGAMGLWAYRLGTRDAAEVPIVRAMEGPARIQPADPGGLQAAHQGLEVNTVLAGAPAETVAPAPRTPAATPAALAEEDGPQGELVIAPPPVLAAEALAAGEDLPLPPADEIEPDAVALIEAPTAVVAADPADSTGVVDEALGATTDPAVAAVETPAEPAAPGPRPLRRPENLVLARAQAPAATVAPAAAPKPAAATPAKPPAREAAAAPAPAPARSGGRMVQLGAFDSEAIARQAWNILASSNRDLLGSKNVVVERTTDNARVFYRLRVAGFEGSGDTQKMCEALRARNVDCIPIQQQ